MRLLAWSLMLVSALTLGCSQPDETIPEITPGSGSSATSDADEGHDHDHDGDDHAHEHEDGAEGEESASVAKENVIRFVADKSLRVDNMMCPYSCYPKVKDSLASLPGVEDVQLAQQPEGTSEGEIKDPVVELKLNGDFDADAAIAALAKIDFNAAVTN